MKKLFLIAVLVLGFALSLAYANIHILNDNVLRIGGGGISVTSSQKAAKIYISSTADPGGDGSRADPYDTFSDINWTTGGENSVFDFIADGTKVYINLQGTFRERLVVGASGTSSAIITIQEYGDGAIIDGAVSFNGDWTFYPSNTYSEAQSWSLNNGEVWIKTSTRAPYSMTENGMKLTPSVAADLTTINRGEFGWDSDVLYYRATDGENPSTHTLYAASRATDGLSGLVNTDGNDYINFRDLTIRYYNNNTAESSGVLTSGSTHLNFLNVLIYGCKKGASFGTSSNISFNGVVRDNYDSGIIVEGATTNLLLEGSYLRNGRSLYYNGSTLTYVGDGDGIGIGGGGGTMSNITIQDATIQDNGEPDSEVTGGGTGIYLGSSYAMSVSNIVIQRCLISGNHDGGLYLGNEHISSNISYNVFDNNLNTAGSTRNAVHIDTRHTSFISSTFANNLVMNNHGNAGVLKYGDGIFILKNNIFYNNGQTSAYRGDLWIPSLTGLTSDFNVFYRHGTAWDSARIIEASPGTTYDKDHIIGTSGGYWQNDSSQDTNSTITDPKLTSIGKLETGSPALNAGVVITGLNDGGEVDIWGNVTPSGTNLRVDTVDTIDTGWTDSGSYEWTCDGTQTGTSAVKVLNFFTAGSTYQTDFTVSNYVAGTFILGMGVAPNSGSITANGSYTVSGEVGGNGTDLVLYGNADFGGVVTIDRITLNVESETPSIGAYQGTGE